jgi:hypothetical protein
MSGPYGMQHLKNQYCSNCKRKKLEDRVYSTICSTFCVQRILEYDASMKQPRWIIDAYKGTEITLGASPSQNLSKRRWHAVNIPRQALFLHTSALHCRASSSTARPGTQTETHTGASMAAESDTRTPFDRLICLNREVFTAEHYWLPLRIGGNIAHVT